MAFIPGDPRASIRNVADLARAGLEIARQPVTKVDFEVHHVRSRHGYLHELTADASFLETVASATNGTGVVIGTRTRAREDEAVELDAGPAHAEPPQSVDDGWIFRQAAWPNPTFIYESAETFSGLIGIDPGAREVSEWHGIAIRDLLKEIAEAAANLAGAPLLTLQCPAQLPTIVKTRNHDLRTRKEIAAECSSLAIRFSVALRDTSAAVRFTLGDRIREVCEKYGFSFWIADTRPGHRAGNWFEVCQADGTFSPLYKGDIRSKQRTGTVLPVTFVGPARIGSTHAIVSFLQRYPQLGVVGCTVTTLADLAFVHLQLAIAGVAADRLNRILGKLLGEQSAPARPRKLLSALFRRLGVEPDPVEQSPATPDPAIDYQTFAGPAISYRPHLMPESLAVWVSWEIAHSDRGLAGPLTQLYRALARVVPELPAEARSLADVTTVEYLLCRATEQSVLRAKAKLAVPKSVLGRFAAGGAQPPPSALCSALEDAWRAQVRQSDVDGVRELTVAWRESWLGHWTDS